MQFGNPTSGQGHDAITQEAHVAFSRCVMADKSDLMLTSLNTNGCTFRATIPRECLEITTSAWQVSGCILALVNGIVTKLRG